MGMDFEKRNETIEQKTKMKVKVKIKKSQSEKQTSEKLRKLHVEKIT